MTYGQEMERVYSYSPGACTGPTVFESKHCEWFDDSAYKLVVCMYVLVPIC